MTLKPNYLLAFIKTFFWFFALIAVVSGVIPYFQGKEVRVSDILGLTALGATFFGIFVAVAFTPREITWDDETIRIRALFPGSGDFEWRQLKAWSPNRRGTFLIKFEGTQAFQIAPAGFRSEDWKVFRSFLERRFPEKKTLFWVGVTPIRFAKKDDPNQSLEPTAGGLENYKGESRKLKVKLGAASGGSNSVSLGLMQVRHPWVLVAIWRRA